MKGKEQKYQIEMNAWKRHFTNTVSLDAFHFDIVKMHFSKLAPLFPTSTVFLAETKGWTSLSLIPHIQSIQSIQSATESF